MVQTTDISTQPSSIDELKKKIRKLNSKAGQMKMDLHDIAEGLPADLDQLPEMAAKTYDIFCQLRELKQQLKTLEFNSSENA
ncbi:MAG: CCE_0567 family metalloprotein [Cyanobacteria bacterium J06633_2]